MENAHGMLLSTHSNLLVKEIMEKILVIISARRDHAQTSLDKGGVQVDSFRKCENLVPSLHIAFFDLVMSCYYVPQINVAIQQLPSLCQKAIDRHLGIFFLGVIVQEEPLICAESSTLGVKGEMIWAQARDKEDIFRMLI